MHLVNWLSVRFASKGCLLGKCAAVGGAMGVPIILASVHSGSRRGPLGFGRIVV